MITQKGNLHHHWPCTCADRKYCFFLFDQPVRFVVIPLKGVTVISWEVAETAHFFGKCSSLSYCMPKTGKCTLILQLKESLNDC